MQSVRARRERTGNRTCASAARRCGADSWPIPCIASEILPGLWQKLIHEKDGEAVRSLPFSFFTALAEEGLLVFDPGAAAWTWGPGTHSRQGLHRQTWWIS